MLCLHFYPTEPFISINVYTTSRRHIDVVIMLKQRRVPIRFGTIVAFKITLTIIPIGLKIQKL